MTKELKKFTLTSIKNIQKAIENNKLVIFVGAGVSRNSGIPTWSELIKELAKDLGIKAKGKDSNGNDIFSNDEFLKIPQYYFNERKEKEYYDKIKEILDKDFQPNDIHKMIFELNPTHIVTTNYDNLLEQQANQWQTNRKYCKVANDIELSTAPNCNYIIKMHGEFDNIVLKESDYDSYSNNFKLTETYVKGLFATHTILFVGFSADDSNVRRILQWIKDIIGDKHQPAYLIDVNDHSDISEEEFRIKFEYYRNQGIFTLYKSQVEDEINENFSNFKGKLSLKGLGLDLYKFLFFIKNYQHFDVNKYYSIIKQLESFNVITYTILNKVFGTNIEQRLCLGGASFPLEKKQDTFELDMLKIKKVLATPEDFNNNVTYMKYNSLLNEEESSFINRINNISKKELTETEIKSLKQIIAALQKRINISSEEQKKVIYIFDIIEKAKLASNKILVDNNYLQHDFGNINLKKNKNSVDIFKKAFFLYNANKTSEAYQELEDISKKYNDNPIIYYISEFNKKTIAGNLKWHEGWRKYTEEEKLIAEEYEKIDLEQIINYKIPNTLKPIVESLTISSIQKDYTDKVIDIVEKIINYKALVESGGTGSNTFVHDLYKKIYEFTNFMINNYIFMGQYKQASDFYYYSIKAILMSYSIKEPNEQRFINFGINKVPYFDFFDFYIIIENLKYKNFKALLDICDIKELKVENKTVIEELIVAFKNTIKSFLNSNNTNFADKISNYLKIFSLIDINSGELNIIVEEYTKLVKEYMAKSNKIDSYDFMHSIHKLLVNFTYSVKQRFEEKNVEFSKEIYEYIILNYKDLCLNYSRDYNLLINNCIISLSNIENYKLKNQDIIDFYIHNSGKIEHVDEIIINLFNIADKSHQDIIKKYIKKDEKYSKFTINNSFVMLEIILNNILNYTNNIESNLLKLINNTIETKLKQERSSDSSREPIIILIDVLLDLILNNKFKNINKLNNLIEKLELVPEKLISNKQNLLDSIRLLKIIVSPQQFDFNNADIRDFIYLPTNIIENIKNNKKSKNAALKIFLRDFNTYKTNRHSKEKLQNIYNAFLE